MPHPEPGRRSPSHVAWAVIVVVLAAMIVLFFMRTGEKAPALQTGEVAEAGPTGAPEEAEAPHLSPASRAAPDPPTAATDAGRLDQTERIDAAKRVLVLAAIAKALAEKGRADERDAPPVYLKPGMGMPTPVEGSECVPAYPREVKEAGIEGEVIVRYTVTTEGEIVDLQFLNHVPELEQAVREALTECRMHPARSSGRALAVYMTQHFRFAIR